MEGYQSTETLNVVNVVFLRWCSHSVLSCKPYCSSVYGNNCFELLQLMPLEPCEPNEEVCSYITSYILVSLSFTVCFRITHFYALVASCVVA